MNDPTQAIYERWKRRYSDNAALVRRMEAVTLPGATGSLHDIFAEEWQRLQGDNSATEGEENGERSGKVEGSGEVVAAGVG
jgi:hypothetical protein